LIHLPRHSGHASTFDKTIHAKTVQPTIAATGTNSSAYSVKPDLMKGTIDSSKTITTIQALKQLALSTTCRDEKKYQDALNTTQQNSLKLMT